MNGYALALGPLPVAHMVGVTLAPTLLAGAGAALLVLLGRGRTLARLPHRAPVLVLGATTTLIRHVSTQPPTPETALPLVQHYWPSVGATSVSGNELLGGRADCQWSTTPSRDQHWLLVLCDGVPVPVDATPPGT